MALAEDMLKYVFRYVMEHAPEEMEFFNSFVDPTLLERLRLIVNSEFAHVTYTEAIELLRKNESAFEYPVTWGCDLQTEHERYLTEKVFQKPGFVRIIPRRSRLFICA
jgi:asparaginyl-tRNA synthetase